MPNFYTLLHRLPADGFGAGGVLGNGRFQQITIKCARTGAGCGGGEVETSHLFVEIGEAVENKGVNGIARLDGEEAVELPVVCGVNGRFIIQISMFFQERDDRAIAVQDGFSGVGRSQIEAHFQQTGDKSSRVDGLDNSPGR